MYIQIWRDEFQESFIEIQGNIYLQFTCDVWNLGGSLSINKTKKVSIITEDMLPFIYLDLFDMGA